MASHRLLGQRIGCGLLAALTLLAGGCMARPAAVAGTPDIVTQKTIQKGRTPITILVKYAFSINAFEAAVEEKFPDIDIVQVGNYTGDMGKAEYAARMEHDDLTDIVMTWPLDVGKEYWADRLLDLSGMSFTGNYNISMLDRIESDGKLYYLPGPAQLRGIVYNKTLFEENGWKVPDDFDGFVELCKTIEASGMRSLQLGLGNGEVLETAFIGYSYANCFSKPADRQWISDYENLQKGSIGDQFQPAFNTFQTMMDAGIWKAGDLDVTYADREWMLFNRQCAMVEDSVLLARMGYSMTGTTDEFALMPFFNPGEDSDWARLYMVCYIGLNKRLAEPQNKAKYDQVMKLMDYISTVEGQQALSADTGATISSLVGAAPPDIPEIKDLLSALNHGRYAIFPEPKSARSALQTGLAGLLRGELVTQQVIKMVDEENRNPPAAKAPVTLGVATKDFTMIETGNFVTDAMREHAGTDFAIFPDNGKDGYFNGKGISARLYQGDVTEVDLVRILPDVKRGEECVLWKLTMTGENLQKALEHAMTLDNDKSGWFYYFSGLKMHYDPLKPPGSRIQSITTADGTAIDPQKTYTVAAMDQTVDEAYVQSTEKTGDTILSILTAKLRQAKTISPSEDGRFVF